MAAPLGEVETLRTFATKTVSALAPGDTSTMKAADNNTVILFMFKLPILMDPFRRHAGEVRPSGN